MKAVIFALVVLLAVDVVGYHGTHLQALRHRIAGGGHEIGSWVYQS